MFQPEFRKKMATLLDSNESLHRFVKKHANGTLPQVTNLTDLLLSLHTKLKPHWDQRPTTIDDDDDAQESQATRFVLATSILLRCYKGEQCPFHTSSAVSDILRSIAASTGFRAARQHIVALVKLLFNIILTSSPAASWVIQHKGDAILVQLLQQPMPAEDARLVCILLERLIATVPSFPLHESLLLPSVLRMLDDVVNGGGRKTTSDVEVKVTKREKRLSFPHGRGRVSLCVSLWNVVFAVVTVLSKRRGRGVEGGVEGGAGGNGEEDSTGREEEEESEQHVFGLHVDKGMVLALVSKTLAQRDNLEGTVFRVRCSAINVLLHTRKSLVSMCCSSDVAAAAAGREMFRSVLEACERWLIMWFVEKRESNNRSEMDATLLPTLLILWKGVEDARHVVAPLVGSRLQECEYLRVCVQMSMNVFTATSRVSVAMGDLAMSLCCDDVNLLIQYVGTGAAMGVLQRRGLVNTGGTT